MPRIVELIRGKLQRLRGAQDVNVQRIRRREGLVKFVSRFNTHIIATFLLVGYLWIIAIPSPRLGRGTFMDENAIQPGQVTTQWGWGDVHAADRYLGHLEHMRDTNYTNLQRAKFFHEQFTKMGLTSATQSYSFSTSFGVRISEIPDMFRSQRGYQDVNGTNAYAVIAAPRTSGSEAMVISASWLSRTGEGDGTLNLRGVASVLALADFLKRFSYWSKDIILIISDGYLAGMQAWLSAYHGEYQTGLVSEPLRIPSAAIWTAVNIDYPGHSFSHLGIFHEGINGRLPNQDLINACARVARWTAGVPVMLYDHADPRDNPSASVKPSWLPDFISNLDEVKRYLYQGNSFLRHIKYQASGEGSGVHGLFHQFRIDAFTLFGVPAEGPHGFHAIGRVIESSLRSMGNLLERLHASFFFYILTGPDRFLQVGHYLASPILISSAMMFQGLKFWVDAAWVLDTTSEKGTSSIKWVARQRPVLAPLILMLATHLGGAGLFALLSQSWVINHFSTCRYIVLALFAAAPLLSLTFPRPDSKEIAPFGLTLKAFNICFASTIISAITVLNFSLAAFLAFTLGIPLCLPTPTSTPLRFLQYTAYTSLGFYWLAFPEEVAQSLWSWQILGVWTAPFVCTIYVPILLQAAFASIMPSS